MDNNEFNFMRIYKALNVVVSLLRVLFENLWNKKYPDTKWTNDRASVSLFEQREEEEFQKNLKRLPKGEKCKKITKRQQYHTILKDDEWKHYKWDISKLAYALIDSKLFSLDVVDKEGIPLSDHIAEIREIRNRAAHLTVPSCSEAEFERTLKSLIEHIKSFHLVYIDIAKYIKEIECIISEEAPITPQERFNLQLELEKLKFVSQIYEQKEKLCEETRKRCKLQEMFIEEQKEKEYWKSECGKMKYKLLKKDHELEVVKLKYAAENQRSFSENESKPHKDEIRNKHSFTESEISSVELRSAKTETKSPRKDFLYEKSFPSEDNSAQSKCNTRRKARSMEIEPFEIIVSNIPFDSDEIRRPHSNNRRSEKALSDNLERLRFRD